MLLKIIGTDLERIGVHNCSLFKIVKWYIADMGFRAVILYRVSNYLYTKKMYKASQIIKNYNLKITGAEISQSCKIGEGLFIAHPNGIVIGGKSVVGKNVTILQQVTLGLSTPDKYHNPTIGDNVYLGCGCKILGDISLGNNCFVGANSVVTKNFDDNLVIAGIPARIINKK